MAKIIGGTATSSMLIPDLKQTNPNRADFVKNKQIFASAINNTASGGAIALTDISPIEHTMEVKARSKNILPYPYQETNLKGNQATHKGITFTVNDDKSITISGVNDGTGTSYFRFVRNANMKVNNCFLSGGISSTCYIRCTDTASVRYGDDSGRGLYVDNVELSSITLMISSGSDFTDNPVTIYPQLEIGTTATAYTPYVDVSTASVKKYGKNLIPFPYPEMNRTYGGVTYKANDDGSIYTSGGTSGSQSWFTLGSNLRFPAGKYILSGCPSGGDGNTYRLYLLRNGSYDFSDNGSGNGAIVTLAGDENVTIRLTVYANKNVDGLTFYPMLRLANTDGTYEPPTEPTNHTPNADGTVDGVTSIYPTTTLIADNGVVLDVEYAADTKKYIDNKIAEAVALALEV